MRQLSTGYVGDTYGKREEKILGIVHSEFILRIEKHAPLEENRRKTEYEGEYVNVETHGALFCKR